MTEKIEQFALNVREKMSKHKPKTEYGIENTAYAPGVAKTFLWDKKSLA